MAALSARFGINPADVDTTTVLDLARDAAHSVARPAAPVSAFVVGLAIGLEADPVEAFELAASLTQAWPG